MQAVEARAGLGRDLTILLGAILATRILLFATSAVTISLSPNWAANGLDWTNTWMSACRWDCGWYARIAEFGYEPVADKWDSGAGAGWAFFPVLPILIHAVMWVTGVSAKAAGFFVSAVTYTSAVVLFYFYATHLAGRKFGLYAGLVLALWPFSVHTSIPMSETVFVPAAIGVFYFARKGQWLTAGLFAAVLSGTRAVGVFGFLPLFMLAIRDYGFWRLVTIRPGTERAALALALSGLGLGLFMVHLYWRTGDALAFSHIQVVWRREFLWPWMMIFDDFNLVKWDVWGLFVKSMRLLTALTILGLTLYVARRKYGPEAVFGLAIFAVVFTAGSTLSFPRLSGSVVPAILGFALLTDRPGWRVPALALSAIGFVIVAWLWVGMSSYAM